MRRKIEEKKKPKLASQLATTAPKFPTRLGDFELLGPLSALAPVPVLAVMLLLVCVAHPPPLSRTEFGGYGVTQLARNVHNKKLYAIKSLLRSTVYKHRQVQHVMNEKQILLTSANAQHVVRLFATFSDRSAVHLCMEFIPGGELLTYIRHHGRFPASVAKFFAAEVVLALEYLHERQIIYRDLKPENILLDLKGHIKLCDFSFARTLHVGDKAWTMCGTPDYIAPEVIACTGHGAAVDWWSLGVLCFEMQAGYPPFAAEDTMKVFGNIQNVAQLQYPPYLDPFALDFIRKLLEPDPAHRLGSMFQGVLQVKGHAWFKTEPVVAWESFLRRTVPAPIVPRFDSPQHNYPVVFDSGERFVHDPTVIVPSDIEHFFNTF